MTAFADGSQNLYPNGASGSRANTEWRTDSYGGGAVTRRTLLHAYATAGEFLLMGSTAMGQGAADILVWNPGLVTGTPGSETIPGTSSFSCAAQRTTSGIPAQGEIQNRAEELAGPDTVPGGGVTNGYTPCMYAAPSTGVYSIAMIGPAGLASNADGGVSHDVALAAAGDFSINQGSSIAAWDVTCATVSPTSRPPGSGAFSATCCRCSPGATDSPSTPPRTRSPRTAFATGSISAAWTRTGGSNMAVSWDSSIPMGRRRTITTHSPTTAGLPVN